MRNVAQHKYQSIFFIFIVLLPFSTIFFSSYLLYHYFLSYFVLKFKNNNEFMLIAMNWKRKQKQIWTLIIWIWSQKKKLTKNCYFCKILWNHFLNCLILVKQKEKSKITEWFFLGWCGEVERRKSIFVKWTITSLSKQGKKKS